LRIKLIQGLDLLFLKAAVAFYNFFIESRLKYNVGERSINRERSISLFLKFL